MFGVQFTGKANKRPLSTDVATRSQCNFPSLRVQTEAFLLKRKFIKSRGDSREGKVTDWTVRCSRMGTVGKFNF